MICFGGTDWLTRRELDEKIPHVCTINMTLQPGDGNRTGIKIGSGGETASLAPLPGNIMATAGLQKVTAPGQEIVWTVTPSLKSHYWSS